MNRSSIFPTLTLLLGAVIPAFAGSITINPTFDPTLTGGEDAAINAAIGAIESDISSPNNIVVSLYFNSMSTGLGESTTGFYALTYSQYYNAFAAVATQPNQLTALASLGAPPGPSTGNPVNGTNVIVTSAEGRNLGFGTSAGVTVGSGTYDSEISLNTSITSPPNGLAGFYGLQSVANHEIDEALGIGGAGSTIGDTTGFFSTGVGDLDLFRYTAPGTRSYSTFQTTSPYSYFSIDAGTTVASYFNQTSGADYADWFSNCTTCSGSPFAPGFGAQVQDAFGQPGTNPGLGINELTAFNAIGYDVIAPEPSTLLLFGSAVAVLAFAGRRRLGLRKSQKA